MDDSVTIIRKPALVCSYCRPCCITATGSCAVTLDTRFCTSTWARSGSVPGANVAVICDWPYESLTDS
ncbi:Uncharacterised protein [Bordetella pertussis]|nr:Uncharacterised protein [Bordetella pertussis]CFN49784.1 Uncharacterised protein [Bordetella pertussis]CFN69675.1 Uncharacterised protein [Bordetella pertussis]CFO00489.1 Uncharacterised protein [Bordetella pertussis]CFO34882.1 Uncharacterised protein [Bordetella pertussis]